MDSSDLSLFSGDSERFGECLARTLRILARLLADWVGGPQTSEDGSSHARARKGYLKAIYFDKLAEAFCGIWDELCDRGKVRFGSSLRKKRGFHGPGRAIRIDRAGDAEFGVDHRDVRRHKWAFSTEIAEKLRPTLSNARRLFLLSGEAWDSECRVQPSIDRSEWERWLKDEPCADDQDATFLSAVEVEYVEAISGCLRCLNEKELRAFGTHYSAAETCHDICQVNLVSWEASFARVGKHLSGVPQDPSRDSYRLVTTAREVRQKADKNRPAYESARSKVLDACRSEDVRQAIVAVKDEPHAIWNDEAMRRIGAVAPSLLALSSYVRRGLAEIGAIGGLTDRERTESDDELVLLSKSDVGKVVPLIPYRKIPEVGASVWWETVSAAKRHLFERIPPVGDSGRYVD